MIIGTGIDIVELKRIEDTLHRHPNFIKRILTEKEEQNFQKLTEKRKIEFLAGRFAAKEAFSKAIGTGIGRHLSWKDVEILSATSGKPTIVSEKTNGKVHLSISHSKEYVVANVIIEL